MARVTSDPGGVVAWPSVDFTPTERYAGRSKGWMKQVAGTVGTLSRNVVWMFYGWLVGIAVYGCCGSGEGDRAHNYPDL